MTTEWTNDQCGHCLQYKSAFLKLICNVCGKVSSEQSPKGWFTWNPPTGMVWQRGEDDVMKQWGLEPASSAFVSGSDDLCSKTCLKERIEQMTDNWYEELGLI